MANDLTEQSYLDRKAELENQHRIALDAHAKTSLDLEMGHVGSDELTKASAAIAEVEARLNGLDAAMNQQRANSARDAAETERLARKASLDDVKIELGRRRKALIDIEKAMKPIGAAVAEYRAATDAISGHVRPYQGAFTAAMQQQGRGLTSLRLALSPLENAYHHERVLIAGLLFNAGVTITDLIDPAWCAESFSADRLFAGKSSPGSVTGRVNRSNGDILRLISDAYFPDGSDGEE